MGTEIRDNPNKRGLMDAGFTDRNGLWGKDFVFAAGARPVNIYVHFASPLFAECTLLTRAPA